MSYLSSNSSSLSFENKAVSFFWGCELNERTRKYIVKEDNLLEHVVYLKSVSLGEDADDKPHVVALECQNMFGFRKPVPVASLCHSTLPMICLHSFELTPPVTFSLKSGTGPVYLSGHYHILEEDPEYDSSEDAIEAEASTDETDEGNDEFPEDEDEEDTGPAQSKEEEESNKE